MSKEYYYDGQWRSKKPESASELAGFLFCGSKQREVGEPMGDIDSFMKDVNARYSEGELPVDGLLDAMERGEKKESLCPTCKGHGFITNGLKTDDPDYQEEDCHECNATGRLGVTKEPERTFSLAEALEIYKQGAHQANMFCGFPSELDSYLDGEFKEHMKEKFNIDLPVK